MSAHHNDELQDLGDGGRKLEVNTLSDSTWIKGSVIIDSGEAEGAAQIGRGASLIGDLPDHHLMAGHHRSAFREPRLSQSTIACSSCLHCQPHCVQIFGDGSPARRHHWRLPRSYGQRACQLSTHLGEALAETQHVWRHMRDGIELPAPQADVSWHPRLGRRPWWMAMVTTGSRTLGSAGTFRRSSPLVLVGIH